MTLAINLSSAKVQKATALLMVFFGLWAGFSVKLMNLLTLWQTDPLRSIGCIMPIATAFFVWKQRDLFKWDEGNWWGLALMTPPIFLMWLTDGDAALYGFLGGHYFSMSLAPTGLLLVLYFSGAVLYFGGISVLKSLSFPLLLLLFVNPVPGIVESLDLQLQTIAAQVARGFAGLLSVQVEPGLLKMMFAPNLGMFIAPGCDGLRGVAAMFCLSMIVGHFYRMPAKHHFAYVLVAVLLAYVMNLVRLCFVVIYYWFALRIDSIAHFGAEIDYVIGGLLFFIAALFLFGYPRRVTQFK
jgi:exosortase J